MANTDEFTGVIVGTVNGDPDYDSFHVRRFTDEDVVLIPVPEPAIPPPTHGQLWPRGVYPD